MSETQTTKTIRVRYTCEAEVRDCADSVTGHTAEQYALDVIRSAFPFDSRVGRWEVVEAAAIAPAPQTEGDERDETD